MSPMIPMPYAVACFGLLQDVSCWAPLARRLMTGQHEAPCVRAGQPADIRRQILAPFPLCISNQLHGIGEVVSCDGCVAMVFPPCAEQLGYALSAWISRLEALNAFNGVAAAQSKQG